MTYCTDALCLESLTRAGEDGVELQVDDSGVNEAEVCGLYISGERRRQL